MKRATRVYVALVVSVVFSQCGLGAEAAYAAYRRAQIDAMFARPAVPPPVPSPPAIPMPPTPMPPTPMPPTPVALPVPSVVAPTLRTGRLALAQMTRDDLTARMVAAHVVISTNDAPDESPVFVADVWGGIEGQDVGGVEALFFDCARSTDPRALCSVDANRIVLGASSEPARFQPLLTADVDDADALARALRHEGLHGVSTHDVTSEDGMRWRSVDTFEVPRVNVYVREIHDVPRRRGAVHVEGSAVLVVLSHDGFDGADALLAAILGP